MSKQFTKFKETEIGAIPEEWDVVDVDKALNIIDGDRGVNYPNGLDFSDNGYCVFLNAKNVCGDSFDFSNCQFISQAKDVELRKGKMQRGDFVLTTRGTVGNIAFYDKAVPFENMRINSGMVILRNDKDFDSKYLFQFLKSWITKKQISELTTGSAQPQLPIRDLKNLKLIRPTTGEQKQIAEILSCLDDKIELNRQVNSNLEKVANSLFKHWFVDFEFPNEEGKPYKSSGGKMTDSELGEIPEGWRVEPISSFGNIVCGKTPSKSIKEYFNGDVPFIKIPDMHGNIFVIKTVDSLTKKGMSFQKNKTIPSGSICVSCIATVGLVSMTVEDSQTNQQINSIIPAKNIYQVYLFYAMKNLEGNLQRIGSSGSATLNVNTKSFSVINILKPDITTLGLFDDTIRPIFDQIKLNMEESLLLSKIRDSLLPRLMSGKIRVK